MSEHEDAGVREGMRRLAAGLPVQDRPVPARATAPADVEPEADDAGFEPGPVGLIERRHHGGGGSRCRLMALGGLAAAAALLVGALAVRSPSEEDRVDTVGPGPVVGPVPVTFAEMNGTRWLVESHTDLTDHQIRTVPDQLQEQLPLDVFHGYLVGDTGMGVDVDVPGPVSCGQFVYDERVQQVRVAPCPSGPPPDIDVESTGGTATAATDPALIRGAALGVVQYTLPGAVVTRDGDQLAVVGPDSEFRARLAGTAQTRTVEWGLLPGTRWTVARSGQGSTANVPAPVQGAASFEIVEPTVPWGTMPFGSAEGPAGCGTWTVNGANYEQANDFAIDCGHPVTDPAARLIGPVLAAWPFAELSPSGLSVTSDAGSFDSTPLPPVAPNRDDSDREAEAAARCSGYARTNQGSSGTTVVAARIASAEEVQTWAPIRAQSVQRAVQAVAADPTTTIAVCVLDTPEGYPVPRPPSDDDRPYRYARWLVHPDRTADGQAFSQNPLDTNIGLYGPGPGG